MSKELVEQEDVDALKEKISKLKERLEELEKENLQLKAENISIKRERLNEEYNEVVETASDKFPDMVSQQGQPQNKANINQ